jgi:ABC-2 type transport system permease protein
MVSIATLAVIATGAVVLFASDADQTYGSFAAAVGVPMTIILPIIAILSVTGEWSQRTGLTTFTLVPRRGRVILAKAVVSVGIGVVSIALAAAIGAVGNIVGSAIAGVGTTWDLSVTDLLCIVLANVLGLLVGFMLGVLLRSSAAAIVAYFVYSFVVPTLSGLLAGSQHWFHKLQPWVDFNFAQAALYDGSPSGQQWLHLAITTVGWVLLPMAIGIAMVMRSEVK